MSKEISELLKLGRPMIVFDVETTGLSISSDRIVELAYLKYYPNGPVKSGDIFLNPEQPISPEATEVHGITDEKVKDMPTFMEKAQEIWDLFSDCYYSGYNISNFDLLILRREFIRVGMSFNYSSLDVIDSKIIMNYMEPRTLAIAYKHYCNKEKGGVSDARADAHFAAEILKKQLELYREIRDLEFLKRIQGARDTEYTENTRKFVWKNGEAYFAFSKYDGEPLKEIAKKDPGFLHWILEAEFSENVKNVVTRALKGMTRAGKSRKDAVRHEEAGPEAENIPIEK